MSKFGVSTVKVLMANDVEVQFCVPSPDSLARVIGKLHKDNVIAYEVHSVLPYLRGLVQHGYKCTKLSDEHRYELEGQPTVTVDRNGYNLNGKSYQYRSEIYFELGLTANR